MSETWVWNDNPSWTGNGTFNVSFVSKNMSYTKFIYGASGIDDMEKSLYYNDVNVLSDHTARHWIDEAYRTIVLDEPATGDLLTFLQANAVKQ